MALKAATNFYKDNFDVLMGFAVSFAYSLQLMIYFFFSVRNANESQYDFSR